MVIRKEKTNQSLKEKEKKSNEKRTHENKQDLQVFNYFNQNFSVKLLILVLKNVWRGFS